MYAWEKPFESIVQKIRVAEMKKIRFAAFIRAVYLALVVFTNRVVLFVTLGAFAIMDTYPSAAVTFMLACYYEVLQFTTTLVFPQALLLIGESSVSIRRLQVFIRIIPPANRPAIFVFPIYY